MTLVLYGVHGGTSPAVSTAYVDALDVNGRLATGYRGSVSFTSSDANAVLPASYTFTALDGGRHAFGSGVSLPTTGVQTVTVTDAANNLAAGQYDAVVGAVDFVYATLNANTPNGPVGQVVDVLGNNAAVGARLTLAPASGRYGQIWSPGTDASLRLVSLCIGLAGGTPSPGMPVELQTCGGGSAQLWRVGAGAIASLADPNYCIFGALNSPAGLTAAPCANTAGQGWLPVSAAPVYSVTAPTSGTCMDTTGYSVTPGTKLQTWGCKGSANQAFQYTQSGSLRFATSCVGYATSLPSPGALVRTAACDGSTSQLWRIIGNSIRPTADHNYCLQAASTSRTVWAGAYTLATCNGDSRQRAQFASTSAFVRLRTLATAANELCLAGGTVGQASSVQPCSSTTTAMFVPVISPSFEATTLAANGSMTAVLGAPTSSVSAGQNVTVLDANAMFSSYAGFLPNFYAAAGAVSLPSAASATLSIDVGTGTGGSIATLQASTAGSSQSFYRTPRAVRVVPTGRPNLCLEVARGIPSAGVALVFQPCSGTLGQYLVSPPDWSTSKYTAFAFGFGNRCVGAAGGLSAGQPLSLEDCDFTHGQPLWMPNVGGPLSLAQNANLCLDGNVVAGSLARLATCTNDANQTFLVQ